MTPEYQQIHHNPIRPSITICPWARYAQSSGDTHGFDTLERETRQWSILSGRSILTVSPESAFLLSFFFSSLLLGLRIQNRQLCPSIAPRRNNDWNKGAPSYRLQRTLYRWCDRAADDSRGSHFAPPEGNLSRSCCWCAIHTAPRQSCQHGFAPPEQRTAERAAADWLWRPGATTASRLRARLHGIVRQRNSTIRRYSLLVGSTWGGRETAGYRVSCPWCNAGTVSAMARSFLLVCRNPGAPVIICGAAARIRLN